MNKLTKMAALAFATGALLAAAAPGASADDGEACVTVLSTEIACVCVDLNTCHATLQR